ncbi:MAG: MBL fold metallo-hydrolase [Clostridia bacterium]
MKVCNFSSGSEGNVTYVETENSKVLVDLGISCTKVEKILKEMNVNPSQIDAILVSHEHTDHTNGIPYFSKKYGTKVFVHQKSIPGFLRKLKGMDQGKITEFWDVPFQFLDLLIEPIEVAHDSDHCVAFTLSENNKKVGIITDLGHFDNNIINAMQGCRLLYVEANHNPKMLEENLTYPLWLKKRIAGNNGHLSNEQSAKLIAKLIGANTKQIMLSHLSHENNTPELAYTEVLKSLFNDGFVEGDGFRIGVATTKPTAIFKLK